MPCLASPHQELKTTHPAGFPQVYATWEAPIGQHAVPILDGPFNGRYVTRIYPIQHALYLPSRL